MTVDEFQKQNLPKRRSRYTLFISDINELYIKGYTIHQIQNYLKTKGIEKPDRSWIYKLLKKGDTNDAKNT